MKSRISCLKLEIQTNCLKQCADGKAFRFVQVFLVVNWQCMVLVSASLKCSNHRETALRAAVPV